MSNSFQRYRDRTNKQDSSNTSELGTVTSSGNSRKEISVEGIGEYREVPLVAPFGMLYNPPSNTNVELSKNWSTGKNIICVGNLIDENILTTDKEAGDVEKAVIESKLDPGEVLLFSLGGATIKLKNDGTIVLNRRLIIHKDGTMERLTVGDTF